MIRKTICLAVFVLSVSPSNGEAQLLRSRYHQVRSCPVTACGLPGKYSYESRFPKKSAATIGYAVPRSTSDAALTGLSPTTYSSRHLFRFEADALRIQTVYGEISLDSLGGMLTESGVFQFSGTLQHDGGRDQILRNPKVTVSVALMSSLSDRFTPPPNPVVVKTYQLDARAEIVGNKMQLGGLIPNAELAKRFPEITHLRVQITHHPEL